MTSGDGIDDDDPGRRGDLGEGASERRADEGGEPSSSGEKGRDRDDKVIRLPRDWLGPRDQLVPFGPSADPGGRDPDDRFLSDDADTDPHVSEAGRASSDAVSADDFWGERSAALQGPLGEDEDEDEDADEDRGEHAWHDEAGWWSRSRVGSLRTRASDLATRHRRSVLAAAVLVGVACLVVAGMSFFAQAGRHGNSRLNAGLNRGRQAQVLGTGSAGSHQPARNPSSRSSQRSASSRPSHHSSSERAVAVRYVPSSTASSSTASSSESSTTSTPASSSSSSDDSAPSSNTPPATTPSSQPSSAPPYGARGALGPGHSPDG